MTNNDVFVTLWISQIPKRVRKKKHDFFCIVVSARSQQTLSNHTVVLRFERVSKYICGQSCKIQKAVLGHIMCWPGCWMGSWGAGS